MIIDSKAMAADLTAQSKGQLQIFSYWVSEASMNVGSMLQSSINNLSIGDDKGGNTTTGVKHNSKRDIFEYATSLPKKLLELESATTTANVAKNSSGRAETETDGCGGRGESQNTNRERTAKDDVEVEIVNESHKSSVNKGEVKVEKVIVNDEDEEVVVLVEEKLNSRESEIVDLEDDDDDDDEFIINKSNIKKDAKDECQQEKEIQELNEKDTGIQSERESHHRVKATAESHTKEKKVSSSSVSHFGTVYQPAGPLIEPHKTVPVSLLPETVKLPADLKVTYQTHPPPPTSNVATAVSHSSSSKANKKHSSSSTSTSSSHLSHSHSKHTTTGDKSSTGQILHQPYKSSSSSAASSSSKASGSGGHHHHQQTSSHSSSSSSTRSISHQNYSGVSSSYVTGSPHVLSSPSLISQQSTAVGQHQQLSSVGLLPTHHHTISSATSSGLGPSSQQLPPSVSAGAPSSGGLFYSTSSGFAPHHSPFAPCKYPMVPPESYRTPSPYPSPFMYPQTTPQPVAAAASQNYFMTPFYTPPLTPNSNPIISAGGLGVGVGGNQPRPLSLAHHHPSIAAASFYQPQSGIPQPGVHHHPSNYLVASPHHSIQPSPAAPGHAGLFHPNPCTQPACPCPTESCQLNNINSNKPLQPRQCSSVVLEGAAKHPKSKSSQALAPTTSKGSTGRQSKDLSSHPTTCTTPALAADPPITIQLINSNGDVQKSQTRQLESAKTFTEQYSLPDDITITPIIVSSASNATKLLLKNTSISVVSSTTGPLNQNSNSPTDLSATSKQNNSSIGGGKQKEKDIVHVIDPRSGQKTTIAKHISNRNLLAKNINKSPKSLCSNTNNAAIAHHGQSHSPPQSRLKPNINKIGTTGVGKLNPDLDVIIINNNTGSQQTCSNDTAENVKLARNNQNSRLKSKGNNSSVNSQAKLGNSSVVGGTLGTVAKGNKGQIVSRRIALADTDNNNPRKVQSSISSDKLNVPFNYSLPPGISISQGVGLNLTLNQNITSSMQKQNLNQSVRPMAVQNSQNSDLSKSQSKKRISLNECIDGLQKKRLKLLEDHNFVVNPSNGSYELVNGNVIFPSNPNGRTKSASGGTVIASGGKVLNHGKKTLNKKAMIALQNNDTSSSSARVRDPDLNRGGTVILSSDAVIAASAVVLDPETYHLTRNINQAKGLRNGIGGGVGLKKGKFQQQSRRNFIQTSMASARDVALGTNSRVKVVKTSNKSGFHSSNSKRNTRSTAAKAKIRTRLSTKPSGPILEHNHANSRSRSRLLRTRNQGGIGSNSNIRKSESDCSSSCTSRSNSAIRITTTPNGRLEREKNQKHATQAFINAVANLYQYRRNVILRVPRAGVGIFPSANTVNMLSLGGGVSSGKSSLNFGQEKTKNQLSPGGGPLTAKTLYDHGPISPRTPAIFNTPKSSIIVGSMAANAAKKRALVKPLSPAAINGALLQMSLATARRTPKWSNGWRFEGDPYESRVFVNNDDQSVVRRCYPAMRHESGDVIQTRDCVLLKSGSKKNDLPFIAKIAALWENPADGEMMFSLLWYYRPEHTEMGRTKEDMPDEIFASKHIDVNSVATIDDRCYVLTFNEYCRYRKKLKQLEEGLTDKPLLSRTGSSMTNNNAAGNVANAVFSGRSIEPNALPSPGKISPEVVFFCRKVYDFRQKRIMKNPS